MKSSVIIATYNGERFIIEQLNSIINQTVLPSEIVISDDGSTDKTTEIITSFFEQHNDLPIDFHLVFNKRENRGVLGNFQNAFDNSHGDYVFFCDQDDVWFPNKVERCINTLEDAEENVLIHNAQILKETEEGTFSPIDKHLLGWSPDDSDGTYKVNGSLHVCSSFYYCIIQGMCICAKREYLLSISPFSKGSYHDYWILFCASVDDSILAVTEDLGYYRIHKDNTAGIPEYKKKRPLPDRLSTFDSKGKESIIKQYIWYKDTSAYLRDRIITDDQVKKMILFFSRQRVDAVSKNKLLASYDLIRAYQSGAYRIDGKILFLHDIAFVWLHSRKTRKAMIDDLDSQLRSNNYQ